MLLQDDGAIRFDGFEYLLALGKCRVESAIRGVKRELLGEEVDATAVYAIKLGNPVLDFLGTVCTTKIFEFKNLTHDFSLGSKKGYILDLLTDVGHALL